MVIITLLLLFSTPLMAQSDLYRFKAEFSKGAAYPGEEVRCEFILYTTLNAVDVEVAKFPEFRGFWKENLILRQGKIPIPYARFSNSQWKKVTLGSYRLTPMLEESSPSIQPMKIVLKNPYQPGDEEILLSDMGSGIRLKPLPPFQSEDPKLQFKGAVGQFQLMLDRSEVPFQTDEPAVVRSILRGEGNFQEISGADLEFPTGVEVLNTHSFTQGSAPYQTQTYEWTLKISREQDFSLPPVHFVYFDPFEARYKTLKSDPIQLRFQTSLSAAEKKPTPVPWPELPSAWSSYRPLARATWFWITQLFLALAVIAFLIFRQQREKRAKFLASDAYKRQQQLEALRKAHDAGDYETFLKLSEQIALLVLKEKAGIRVPGQTRLQILERASGSLDPALIARARKIFDAHDLFSFSPTNLPPKNLNELMNSVDELIAA